MNSNEQDSKIPSEMTQEKYTLEQLLNEHRTLALPRDTAWLGMEDLKSELLDAQTMLTFENQLPLEFTKKTA